MLHMQALYISVKKLQREENLWLEEKKQSCIKIIISAQK